MVSQNKLIKEGIRYTDALFEEISKRLEQGVRSSDTLEEFLEKTKEYTKANPLATSEYDKTMLNLILSETNNHRFSRPAQKELVRVTIEEKVGEKIHDVGEDIKDSVRDIVKHGYNNNLPQEKIAENISNRVSSIKNRRARAIARTEIARAAIVSDFVINKERGATGWYVECRNTACPVCKKAWHKKWTPENDDSFNPSDETAGGKGWVGDKVYSMEDTRSLPPVHPNCRCVVYYIADSKGRVSTKPFTKPATDTPVTGGELPIPTPAQLKKNLRPGEREKYNSYQRNIVLQRVWLKDNPNASAEDIAKHRKRLAFLEKKFNELKRKALGGSTGGTGSKPKAKPKTTAKPKTNKPKTTSKPKEKPKAKPKATKPKTESKPTTTQTPTKEQINKNLAKKEQTEYKNLETEVKWANDIINSSTSTDKQKNYAKKRLDTITPRFNELTNKALGLTTKTKTTKKSNKSKKKAKETVEVNKPKNARLTKEECDSLTFEQLAEHHNAKYKGLVKIEKDNNKEYHVFEQTFENGETFKLHVEKSAVNSYKKEGVATANEIIHEVFKVPELFRKETNDIWFRNSQKGLVPNSRGGYKSLGKDEGGSNTHKNKRRWNLLRKMGQADDYNDPDHKIVINPKHFKKLKEFLDILTWRNQPKNITKWKHAIHHEFVHSIDTSRDIWKNDKESLSSRKDFLKIENEEPDFTVYAHTQISESFAEHGGYISYMLANPEEQSKKMEIITYERDEKGRQKSFKPIKEEIDFEEYKKRFPKHYEYFTKLLKEEVKE